MQSDRMTKKSDLAIMAEFVLEAGLDHIHWNSNQQPTFVKSLMLKMVRRKIPSHVKQAFFQSNITPDKHETLDDIKNEIITLTMPKSGKTIAMTFENFYTTYIESSPEKSSFHQDDQSIVTEKERAERNARNASRVLVGNCQECGNICEMMWYECNSFIRRKLNLPAFMNETPPIMEKVHYIIGENHRFNIINRDPSSNLSDISSWIKNDREVFIIDMWDSPNQVISVNEQLNLPVEKRNVAFETIRKNLENGAKLETISASKLGAGHSSRWIKKGKDKYYFLNPQLKKMGFFDDKNKYSVHDDDHRPTYRYLERDHPYSRKRIIPHATTQIPRSSQDQKHN